MPIDVSLEKINILIRITEKAIDLAKNEERIFERLLQEVKSDLERFEAELEVLRASIK